MSAREGRRPPAKARLFVALALPETVRAELAAWCASSFGSLAALRPLADESLHVTLCFLGWLPVAEVDPIAVACAGALVGFGPVSLRCRRVVWLPPRRPGVVAVELVDEGERSLAEVQAALSRALREGGWYEPERRAFLPHVTVARVRRGARVRPPEAEAPAGETFVGDRVVLYRSHPGRGGSRYEELAAVSLRS